MAGQLRAVADARTHARARADRPTDVRDGPSHQRARTAAAKANADSVSTLRSAPLQSATHLTHQWNTMAGSRPSAALLALHSFNQSPFSSPPPHLQMLRNKWQARRSSLKAKALSDVHRPPSSSFQHARARHRAS
jgi:hypothetical protein